MIAQPAGRFDWERIVRRASLEPTTKLIALALATYANADGSSIHPGVKRLAAVSGVSDRSVKRALVRLRELQLVTRTSQGSGLAEVADRYRLTIPDDLLERLPLLNPEEDLGSASSPSDVALRRTERALKAADTAGRRRPASDIGVPDEVTPVSPGERCLSDIGVPDEVTPVSDLGTWVSRPSDTGVTPPEHDHPLDQITSPSEVTSPGDDEDDEQGWGSRRYLCRHGVPNGRRTGQCIECSEEDR